MKKTLGLFLLLTLLSLQSCLQVANEVKNWTEVSPNDEVFGTYQTLENDAIKVYLPKEFKRYSASKYQQLLDSLATKEAYEFEIKRLKSLREMKGDFYIFFDTTTHSTYTINTVPFMPIRKRDAQYLLSIIKQNQAKISANSNLKFTRKSAKYNEGSGPQIFNVVHKIEDTNTQIVSYNSSYIMSHNDKTVFINLTTPFEVAFDPYLHKMIL